MADLFSDRALPERQDIAGRVRKRADGFTPAQDPPERRDRRTPRSERSERQGRRVDGGDNGDGNDSDDDRRGGRGFGRHADEEVAPRDVRREQTRDEDVGIPRTFDEESNYTFSNSGSNTYAGSSPMYGNVNRRVHPFQPQFVQGIRDREYAPSGRSTYDAPYDYLFPERPEAQVPNWPLRDNTVLYPSQYQQKESLAQEESPSQAKGKERATQHGQTPSDLYDTPYYAPIKATSSNNAPIGAASSSTTVSAGTAWSLEDYGGGLTRDSNYEEPYDQNTAPRSVAEEIEINARRAKQEQRRKREEEQAAKKTLHKRRH